MEAIVILYKISDLISSKPSNSDSYDGKYINIKVISDDHLPLKKTPELGNNW